MYLYANQLNKSFMFRKVRYDTPFDMLFNKEYTTSIIFKLQQQNITDYVISAEPIKSKAEQELIEKEKQIPIVKIIDVKNAPLTDSIDSIDSIKSIESLESVNPLVEKLLGEILEKTSAVEGKIDDISDKNLLLDDMLKRVSGLNGLDGPAKMGLGGDNVELGEKEIGERKDDENTFIPEINLDGFGISAQNKVVKSDKNDSQASVAALRELLKKV